MRKRFGWSAWLLATALLGGCGGGGDEAARVMKSAAPTVPSPMQARKAVAPIPGDFVANGSFEQGDAAWTARSSANYPVIGGFERPPSDASTGSRYAWLGGADNVEDTLTQTLTVPDGPGRVLLEFWYQVQTEESVESVYDTLDVVATIDGLENSHFITLSNLHTTNGWTRAGPIDLTYYRGKTFQLRFVSRTDSDWPTSFLIDDVSVYRAQTAGVVPATGMWWNPAQQGRGFFLDQQGDQLLVGAYMFERDGHATWYSGLFRNPVPQLISDYSGDLLRHTGGQSLTGAWRAPTAGKDASSVHIQFVSPTRGYLEGYAADGSPIAIAVERFSASGGAPQPSAARFQNGMWWSEAESGRGYVVDVQGSTVLFGAFMYTGAGQPVWYVATTSLTSPDGFVAELQQMTDGQTLAGGWRPATALPGRIGSIRFEASSPSTATLTLPDGRQVAIRRLTTGG